MDSGEEDREDLARALAAARGERDALTAQLERIHQRHRLLSELNRWAVGVEDPMSLVRPMLEVCTQEIETTCAGIYLLDATGVVALVASSGRAETLPAVLSLDALAKARAETPGHKVTVPELMYEYIVPVSERGALVGAIVVRRQPAQPLASEDLHFIYGVTVALATAVAVWAADRELRHLSMHDALTALPNRLFFAEHLDRAIARSARTGTSVAVFFIDLDDFKSVNDSWGHRAGDEVLVEAARRLAGAVRAGDLVARLAGDEFVAVVESVDEATVAAVTARLLAAFDEPIVATGAILAIRASVGVALTAPGVTGEATVALADIAMYAHKATRKR